MDWYSRAVYAGLKIKMPGEVLYCRRSHDDNIGILKRDLRADYLDAIRATLARWNASSQTR